MATNAPEYMCQTQRTLIIKMLAIWTCLQEHFTCFTFTAIKLVDFENLKYLKIIEM
jgi:hypothetical protein